MDPKGWDKIKLKEFLSAPLTQENKNFDLKTMIPGDDKGKLRLKQEFCAYANSKGGFFLFGVDNKKKIVGIDEDTEFSTKISQIVTKHIYPATIQWELYECISLESEDKYIYIVKVFESSYWNKPHVYYKESEGLHIPIRENGDKRDITDGAEIRRIFFKQDNFYPEYGSHILNIFKELKSKARPEFTLIEGTIIQGYKSFLRSSVDSRYSKIVSC